MTEGMLREFFNTVMKTSGLSAGDCVTDVYLNQNARCGGGATVCAVIGKPWLSGVIQEWLSGAIQECTPVRLSGVIQECTPWRPHTRPFAGTERRPGATAKLSRARS